VRPYKNKKIKLHTSKIQWYGVNSPIPKGRYKGIEGRVRPKQDQNITGKTLNPKFSCLASGAHGSII
jgi:hypothetical protein